MLKGSATIELTDVKTGEKKVIKHNNMTTNAIQLALSTPFAFDKRVTQGESTYSRNLVPLCPNLIGGILLYEDNLEEDANRYYASFRNKLVGYSSKDVSESTDKMRGSMNQTESGPLEDGSGYRFVFDFGTDQANGTISSVGLTSKWGGVSGLGSKEVANCRAPYVNVERRQLSSTEIEQLGVADAIMGYINLLNYDMATEIGTAVYVSGKNAITVGRVYLPTINWSLADGMSGIDLTRPWEYSQIETKVFAGSTSTSYYRYYTFSDGGDGYIWGFEHADNAAGNSSGKAVVNWIKIKLEDLTFEEGTWEIEAQLYRFATRYTAADSFFDRNTIVHNHAIVSEGFLYCCSYDLSGVYVINLANITDVTLLKHPDGAVTVYNQAGLSCQGTSTFCKVGNNVCFWNGWINVDEIIPNNCKAGYTQQSDNGLHDGYIQYANTNHYPGRHGEGYYGGVQSGVFAFQYQLSWNSWFGIYVTLMPTYLATINNLPTPVQKTADKTMKITYILREE